MRYRRDRYTCRVTDGTKLLKASVLCCWLACIHGFRSLGVINTFRPFCTLLKCQGQLSIFAALGFRHGGGLYRWRRCIDWCSMLCWYLCLPRVRVKFLGACLLTNTGVLLVNGRPMLPAGMPCSLLTSCLLSHGGCGLDFKGLTVSTKINSHGKSTNVNVLHRFSPWEWAGW